MLIQFQLSQTINYPIEKTFLFLADLRNMVKWNYYILKMEKISESDIEIGTTFKQQRPHDTNFYKITQLTKPTFMGVALLPPAPNQHYSFSLSGNETRTTIIYNWQVDLRKYKLLKFVPGGFIKNWLLSFAKKHVMKNIKPSTEQNFLNLKTLLETGKAVLQDGRETEI